MELQTNYLSKFSVSKKKVNPAWLLFKDLSNLGVSENQIWGLMGRHHTEDLRELYFKILKSGFPNLPALYVKLADKELPLKPKKPRQLRIPRIIKRIKTA